MSRTQATTKRSKYLAERELVECSKDLCLYLDRGEDPFVDSRLERIERALALLGEEVA